MGRWCIDGAEDCIETDEGYGGPCDVRAAHFDQRCRKFFSKA
ncbi:hypothetical protein GGR73_002764 [Xanthomonas sp. F14]